MIGKFLHDFIIGFDSNAVPDNLYKNGLRMLFINEKLKRYLDRTGNMREFDTVKSMTLQTNKAGYHFISMLDTCHAKENQREKHDIHDI